jgi:iron complex outermembrane receptor protein
MAPGIEVAQVDSGRYAVSARGFNGRFTNKLQVLVDGRSIYSPIFSGVMWEHDPVALDDIERIEVIRGPGAAMWGANAVNGVINIITRHSAAQESGQVVPTIGTNGFGQIYGRYNKHADDRSSWKLSFQGRRGDPSTQYNTGTESNDWLRNGQVNFRFDHNLGSGSEFSFWAGAARLKMGDLALVNPELSTTPHLVLDRLEQIDDSQMIAGRYRWLAGAVESSIQLSATTGRIEISGWVYDEHQTYDLDYQGRTTVGPHDLLWGISHRTSTDELVSATPIMTVTPPRFTQRSTGLFVHDEWTLIPERLQFAFGARWENSNVEASACPDHGDCNQRSAVIEFGDPDVLYDSLPKWLAQAPA